MVLFIGPIPLIDNPEIQNQYITKLPPALQSRIFNKQIDSNKPEDYIRMVPSRRVTLFQRCFDALCYFGFLDSRTMSMFTSDVNVQPVQAGAPAGQDEEDVFAGVKGV